MNVTPFSPPYTLPPSLPLCTPDIGSKVEGGRGREGLKGREGVREMERLGKQKVRGEKNKGGNEGGE